MNIFEEAKERLNMDEVARFYGFKPDHANFICCPFHREKSASLKLYPGSRGWHCFGCGRGGSVIDFVSELHGLDSIGAVRRLNEDFHLALPVDRPPTQTERTEAQRRRDLLDVHAAFEDWRDETIRQLNSAFRVAHLLRFTGWDDLTDAESLALREQAHIEFLSDVLSYGTLDEKMEIFRNRKGVAQLCSLILKSTPKKSEAA